jgi:RHS repeat-associated protein
MTLPNEDPDQDGITTTVNLRFPGQYYDQESTLHYNWNRYYDPRTGRYIASDPIGIDGGLNTYGYVRNNALRWTDEAGLLDPADFEPAAKSATKAIAGRAIPIVGAACAGVLVGTIIYNTFDEQILDGIDAVMRTFSCGGAPANDDTYECRSDKCKRWYQILMGIKEEIDADLAVVRLGSGKMTPAIGEFYQNILHDMRKFNEHAKDYNKICKHPEIPLYPLSPTPP